MADSVADIDVWQTVALIVASGAAVCWILAFWRSRRWVAQALHRRAVRTLSLMGLIAVVVLGGFVRPVAGPEATFFLELTWALIRGMTLIVGLSYWLAGPPAGVPPL